MPVKKLWDSDIRWLSYAGLKLPNVANLIIFFPSFPFVSFVLKTLHLCSARTLPRILVAKFDQLRPFLVFHRLFTIIFSFSGVFEFDAVRVSPALQGAPVRRKSTDSFSLNISLTGETI